MNAGIKAVVLLCVLLTAYAVAGCASALVYNHADWLLTRQLDAYFDLTRSQKQFVAGRLDHILNHHRHEALPRYEDVLEQARARVQRGLTPDDVEWALAQYDQLRADLFTRFVQDGAEFVRLLEEPQIAQVRKALEKRLAKQEELVRGSADARQAHRTERIMALVKEWLGPLTRQQEQDLSQIAMAFPDTLPVFYAHQRRRNEELIEVLHARMNGDTRRRLHQWLVDQDRDTDPTFLEATRSMRRHLSRLVLAIDRTATPAQRGHVLSKLDELAHTVQNLRKT